MRFLVLLLIAPLALIACQKPSAPCGPATCSGCCVDVKTCLDPTTSAQCGSQGAQCAACGLSFTCQAGFCIPPSATGGGAGGGDGGTDAGTGGGGGSGGGGASRCAGTLVECSATCVDVQSSVAHCGRCGASCSAGEVCNRGTCAPLPADCRAAGGCAPGYFCEPASLKCLPGCRLPVDCPPGAACNGTTCQCPAGRHLCGEACVPDDSTASCGASCTACPSEQNASATCASGACGIQCVPDALRCNGACALCSTPANATRVCSGASCDFTCPGTTHRCGTQCLANNSVDGCGMSCAPCATDANGTTSCNGTSCALQCNAGFRQCAGACAPCTTPANATPLCTGAACDFTCNTGFHRCGQQCLSNTSVESCGTSCTPCPTVTLGSASCAQGACGITCNTGLEYAAGQCGAPWAWQQRTSGTPGPSARYGAALGFHAQLNKVVLFGGTSSNPATPPAETWTWDGANWVQLSLTTQPSSRSLAAMVYDPMRQRLVLFGGMTVGSFNRLNDTWEFDGSTWTRIVTAASPPIRASPGMAYDAQRQRVVLFGGTTSVDTWEYDGTSWTQRAPPLSPVARAAPAMAFDVTNGVSVLFSGFDPSPTMAALNDTWAWDGTSWRRQTTPVAPPARTGHALVAQQDGLLLFGGSTSTAVYAADTWLWNGLGWNARVPGTAPTARYLHGMAFDSVRGRVVMFGGYGTGATVLSDTWEYGP